VVGHFCGDQHWIQFGGNKLECLIWCSCEHLNVDTADIVAPAANIPIAIVRCYWFILGIVEKKMFLLDSWYSLFQQLSFHMLVIRASHLPFC